MVAALIVFTSQQFSGAISSAPRVPSVLRCSVCCVGLLAASAGLHASCPIVRGEPLQYCHLHPAAKLIRVGCLQCRRRCWRRFRAWRVAIWPRTPSLNAAALRCAVCRCNVLAALLPCLIPLLHSDLLLATSPPLLRLPASLPGFCVSLPAFCFLAPGSCVLFPVLFCLSNHGFQSFEVSLSSRLQHLKLVATAVTGLAALLLFFAGLSLQLLRLPSDRHRSYASWRLLLDCRLPGWFVLMFACLGLVSRIQRDALICSRM